MGSNEGTAVAKDVAKELGPIENNEDTFMDAPLETIKDKIAQIDGLTITLESSVGYCLNSFQGNSAPEKNPSESDMDYDLALIIDRLKNVVANLYIG